MPSPGYRVSGKEVEVRDSGSRHHQLCGCCDLQLIQSHAAPSHGPPARVLSPLFFLAKSLLLPKPRGKKKPSKTSWSSLLSFRTLWSFSPFQNRVALSLSPQNLVVLFTSPKLPDPLPSPPKPCDPPIHSRTMWPPIYLLQNHMALFLSPQNLVVLSFWLPHLGFKSQHPSSFAAPFPTPPTVSYTCQHPRILPALLGCHSSPMAWSQSSPSSHAGPVTRGSCFLDPSWVEVTPISLAQSRATAI